MKELQADTRKRARKIISLLRVEYPKVQSALEYSNPFQLIIATILSAQCTDARVNIVTKSLFKKYKSPNDFLIVPLAELEKDIFSTGFYKQKARSIKGCCSELIEKHGGEVPRAFEALTQLPGVGRKTASVVVGNAFGIPAIAVDTHVKRISRLLGFTDSADPVKIEFALKEVLPEKDWVDASHLIATLGRNVCFARKPQCTKCPIADYCPSFKPENMQYGVCYVRK
ncbi:MAG: endonuclease III [Ignavibacteria bacterium]|nr:endonuclease III [Ignavibacteria bacterium]